MRLTNLSDYAMRLLMYLGRHPERLCTIAEVAQAYGISEPHLMKITHRLARNGWVHTVRGKHGGMRLAHEPGAIPLGAVIRDTENDLDLVECLGAHSSCTLTGECGLAHIVQGALQAFMDHLDQHTLADLLPPAQAVVEAPVRLVRSNRSVS
ncbi:MAG: Rrf2 family transcriptional regulator [Alcaligenaceae bacterium]|nr:Rrf2 family transcriptional regulator [Alcaligenaceae bacterium]